MPVLLGVHSYTGLSGGGYHSFKRLTGFLYLALFCILASLGFISGSEKKVFFFLTFFKLFYKCVVQFVKKRGKTKGFMYLALGFIAASENLKKKLSFNLKKRRKTYWHSCTAFFASYSIQFQYSEKATKS